MADHRQIAVVATRDTKEEEALELERLLAEAGWEGVAIDATPSRWLSADELAAARDAVMALAGERIAARLEQLVADGQLAGMVAIAGASGAALAAPALQRLPLGVPKVLVSPVASGVTSHYVGSSDVVLIHPVVDFCGRNAFVDRALARAAQVVTALAAGAAPYPRDAERAVGLTAFGVTGGIVDRLVPALRQRGRDAVVFSANGVGGQAFEQFLRDGRLGAAIDLTTTELADELCGGVLSAGATRLTAAADLGLPQVVLPGALDIVNFGSPDTVPAPLRGRATVHHTPSVTLVRTTPEENEELARRVAARLAPGGERAAIIVPLQGFSLLSAPGRPFHDPEADRAFLRVIRDELGDERVTAVDAPINSKEVCMEILRVSRPWTGG
jgi:uncharacterized protein (UPF0261 family)